MPRNEAIDMVQCGICDRWYHYNCASLTLAEAKRINESKEMWMCNHNGCYAVYIEIFLTLTNYIATYHACFQLQNEIILSTVIS